MFSTILTLLGTATFGAFAWIFQLGNRVTILETHYDDLETLLDAKFEPVNRRLTEIEHTLREMNNV